MVNKFEIVDQDECEEAQYIVCCRLTQPLLFPDNLIDICCKCGEAIQHRPHVPTAPQKMCEECALPDLDREATKGNLNIMITPKTAAEVANYIKKRAN